MISFTISFSLPMFRPPRPVAVSLGDTNPYGHAVMSYGDV